MSSDSLVAMWMVVDCLTLLWLLLDDLLHLAHGGGLLLLLDCHMVHVWPGKGALPSTLLPRQDDFATSLGKVSGQAPARLPGLLLHDVGHLGGHLLVDR